MPMLDLYGVSLLICSFSKLDKKNQKNVFRCHYCDSNCDDRSVRLWNVDVALPHRQHLHHHRDRHQHLCYRIPTVISDILNTNNSKWKINFSISSLNGLL